MKGQTRRSFLKRVGIMAAAPRALAAGPLRARRSPQEDNRPNILWITSEDNSPLLGCYGDKQAHTPNLDRLATQGVRYRNAFANAPVCSAARSTLITGMYACSLGIHHHRSKVRIPDAFRLYPEYLREAGYYCTNNSKTDYNIVRQGAKVWDESSNKAHYQSRRAGQPFFAVFNLGSSHEGQLTEAAVRRRREQGVLPPAPRVAPEDVTLPPYHADTPTVRRDWSVYYDNMTLMDQQVGRLLKELQDNGQAEDTIVFYYADHGGALPRGKRNIHDSGTRVPLIVRFPEKWKHLAPASPGAWVEDPVSFVDLPAAVFSLAGVAIPKHFEGRAFLGTEAMKPRDHALLFRGRMDERYDTARAVRTRRYRYIRNYSPHRPWGQHYSYPFRVMPSMDSWYQAYRRGQCNAVQARYWQAKPSEELYDIQTDPHEVTNLVDNRGYATLRDQMRRMLHQDLLDIRDTGFIPEGMFEHLTNDRTLYAYAQSAAYPIERIVEIADAATSRDPAEIDKLLAACDDPHPVVRYWGATGLLVLQKKAAPGKAKLEALLEDRWLDIRVVAAEALAYLGETDEALATLEPIVNGTEKYASLAALNALDFMHQAGHVPLERIRKMVRGGSFQDTPERMVKYFLGTE